MRKHPLERATMKKNSISMLLRCSKSKKRWNFQSFDFFFSLSFRCLMSPDELPKKIVALSSVKLREVTPFA